MGQGINYKCSKCGYENSFQLGVGMLYPMVYEGVVADICAGKYGREWKQFFEDNEGTVVDAEIYLYQCPDCRTLQSDYSLALYRTRDNTPPKQDYWIHDNKDRQNYQYIRGYIHKCPNCGRRMKRQNSSSPPCPVCGTALGQGERVFWD